MNLAFWLVASLQNSVDFANAEKRDSWFHRNDSVYRFSCQKPDLPQYKEENQDDDEAAANAAAFENVHSG